MQVWVPIRGAVSGLRKLRDVLALIEQVRFDFGGVPTNPESNVEKIIVSMTGVLFPEHVAERNSPILIHIPLLVIQAGFGRRHHDDFRGAVEERHVSALQFITKVNRKRDRSRIRHLLAARNGITTTRGAPRTRLFGFPFRSTVEAYPRFPGNHEIHRHTAATRDVPSAAILNCRHPAVRFVPANIASSLRSEQDGVLLYSRLAVVLIHRPS